MKILQELITEDLFSMILCIFSITVLAQLYYVLVVHRKLAFYTKKESKPQNTKPISVIIAARNECDKLFENLPSIMEQSYSVFEVIVVNHQSIDDSKEILDAFSKQYKNLKVVELAQSKHLRAGKKLPLTIGIKAAQYENLIFTDADCKPISKYWIQSMAQEFGDTKEIVLGYGPMLRKKGFLNKLIRFDTSWIALNYLSMALHDRAYMGVGRNLAYTKSLFFSVDGFKSHYSIASGDDDLFIQEASKPNNCTIQIEPISHMPSPPKDTISEWVQQKSRHYTTSTKYKFIKKVLLAIYPVSLIMTWISFVSLIALGNYNLQVIIAMGILYCLKWWIQGLCLMKLQEKRFALLFPLWDLFYALFIPTMYVIAKNKKNAVW